MGRKKKITAPGTDLLVTELNESEQLFCHEYLKEFNGTQSYLSSYKPGISYYTAASAARKLLLRPEIEKYIDFLKHERIKRVEITIDSVVREIAKVAFVNSDDYYNSDGSLKQLSELTREQKAAIAEVTNKVVFKNDEMKIVEVKIKFHDKLGALKDLAKHVGAYEKHNEQKGAVAQIYIPDNQRK